MMGRHKVLAVVAGATTVWGTGAGDHGRGERLGRAGRPRDGGSRGGLPLG